MLVSKMNSIRRRIPAQAPALLLLVIAMSLPSAFANDVLRGKVQKADQPVRIARPTLPVVGETARVDIGTMKLPVKPIDDNFTFNFETPQFAPKDQPKLEAGAEDASLVIEWEEWHRRVSQAIFERWRVVGVYPGRANTTIVITSDRRVRLNVESVELDPNIYGMVSPVHQMYSPEQLQRDYAAMIEQSVMPLDGSSIVAFPKGSKRRTMTLTPWFSNDSAHESCRWEHGDKERVSIQGSR
jgi:hypothetical protein